MNGPEHYREAQAHLAVAAAIETDGHDDSMSAWHQRQASARHARARRRHGQPVQHARTGMVGGGPVAIPTR